MNKSTACWLKIRLALSTQVSALWAGFNNVPKLFLQLQSETQSERTQRCYKVRNRLWYTHRIARWPSNRRKSFTKRYFKTSFQNLIHRQDSFWSRLWWCRYRRPTHYLSQPAISCSDIGRRCRFSHLWSLHLTNFNCFSGQRNNFFRIAAHQKVLQEATETLLSPTRQPNIWRTRQKKKKRCRHPQIVFESAESEIKALSDTCTPQSRAQANLQPRENCQALHTVNDGLEPQSIIM